MTCDEGLQGKTQNTKTTATAGVNTGRVMACLTVCKKVIPPLY